MGMGEDRERGREKEEIISSQDYAILMCGKSSIMLIFCLQSGWKLQTIKRLSSIAMVSLKRT